MKKICILLVLLMALPAGSLFSAPQPPFPIRPRPPDHWVKPPLVGHWEGTGNFLLYDFWGRTRRIEAEVLLDIASQDGNKFIGTITARYMDDDNHNFIFIGGYEGIPVAGTIQGDSATTPRPVGMLGGLGGDCSPESVIEIEGQYEAKVRPPEDTMSCRWRMIDYHYGALGSSGGLGYHGAPAVGEFTVTLRPPTQDVDR
jgi:hypothetical protein